MSEQTRPPSTGRPGDNHGVQQYGGHSSVANQAVGPGARAVAGDITVHAPGTGERARVEELIRLVERLLEEHRRRCPTGRRHGWSCAGCGRNWTRTNPNRAWCGAP